MNEAELIAEIKKLREENDSLRSGNAMVIAWGDFRDRAKAEVAEILGLNKHASIHQIIEEIRKLKAK